MLKPRAGAVWRDTGTDAPVEVYEYVYRGPVFTRWDIERVLGVEGEGVAATDCCTVERRVERVAGGLVCVDDVCFEEPDPASLRGDAVYMVVGGLLAPVEARGVAGVGYARLRCLADCSAPTVEINGIHMHRIEGVDPWRDTLEKVRAARVRPGHRVLDTCTGLGYTAIASARAGASMVVTVEVSEAVLWLAERNPWSRGLGDERITIIHGDVTRVVRLLPAGFFDRVIHDPPRFSRSTGDLYSLSFYRELYRVLRPGGLLFHYTGAPRRRRGVNIAKGVSRRLREAGFTGVRFIDRAAGIVARKPRA